MNKNYNAIIIIAIATFMLNACISTGSATTGGKEADMSPLLLEATKQRTLPGRPEMEPTTDYNFVMVWRSTEKPTSFFWRGEDGWTSCSISEVHNYTPVNKKNPSSDKNYNTTVLSRDVHANDTLELYPVSGGKYPTPEAIPQEAQYTIYYKTETSGWQALRVNNIIERPDIVMP